ncbi:MAG: acetyl-CoA carboxylase, biotin carboxyl carrier protein [Candidatus Fischerbacteria bacterium RBG_13_37_8]|uniref:Biotin carboxyl carrier protein of acetyl-CoA carboxylase n=1 Tax=Candidatus Fischerbacteria bacterium RBG_13_37_8 TaxID=1817863 RepID=A0A1F5VUA4_9BACT|nr:MAG: acetyl-CoA carboxylase, biotin carboxyl carrier protein [Candidatus Fischerbacteria bacterium RBG_13_37_8]
MKKENLGLDLSELKNLFNLLKECHIDEFELEKPGLKIKVRQDTPLKDIERRAVSRRQHEIAQAIISEVPITDEHSIEESAALQEEISGTLHYITSPMVGTFYRASTPDSDSFVDIGQEIKPGNVVCIIEAMKIMNEIESDIEGEVVAIYVGNAEPVEFGQKLIAVKLKT